MVLARAVSAGAGLPTAAVAAAAAASGLATVPPQRPFQRATDGSQQQVRESHRNCRQEGDDRGNLRSAPPQHASASSGTKSHSQYSCAGLTGTTSSPRLLRNPSASVASSSQSLHVPAGRARSFTIANASVSAAHNQPFARRTFSSSASARASAKDPYSTLGVKRDASAKDIKSAYYGLAKKYHPDTSKEKGAKERFVEIQSAYDILSDDKKKAAFDRYGTTDGQPGFDPFGGAGGGGPGFDPFGGGGGGGFGGFGGFQGFQGGTRDASDIFEGLFGSAFGGRGRSSGAGFAGESRGEDIDTNINISFEEACRGTSKRVTISPVERCSTCEGRGLKKDRHKRTCGVCNGTGTRTFVIQSGFQMASTCPACNGAGETVAPGDECGTCEGVGRVRTRKSIDVKVPPGVDDGAKIRMDGQGDVPLQGAGTPGSLYVRIGVRPSKIWRRQGSNLYYPATVPFHTAILGGKVRVPTLDGDVDVRVPSGTQVGDEMLLRGRGVPSLLRRGDKGDLLVQFEVQIPRSLTKRQREILQQYVDDLEGRAPPPPPPQPQSQTTAAQSPSQPEPKASPGNPSVATPPPFGRGKEVDEPPASSTQATEGGPEDAQAEATASAKDGANGGDANNAQQQQQQQQQSDAKDERSSDADGGKNTP